MAAHEAHLAGVPLLIPRDPEDVTGWNPALVSFYPWHLPDPILFQNEIRVTPQQIGAIGFTSVAEFETFKSENEAAGKGWRSFEKMDERERAGAHGLVGDGMYERQDAVCSVAYTYCREPQAVPGLEPAVALSDLQV